MAEARLVVMSSALRQCPPMSKSLKRVRAALEAANADAELRETALSRTAADAAAALGCAVDQIAKSIILRGESSGEALLFVTAGGQQVDLEKALALLSLPRLIGPHPEDGEPEAAADPNQHDSELESPPKRIKPDIESAAKDFFVALQGFPEDHECLIIFQNIPGPAEVT